MAKLHQEHHPYIDGQEISMTIYYWGKGHKKMGYYASVVPVKRSTSESGFSITEFGAFTGFNACLLEVDRQSKKRLETAIKTLQEKKEEFLNYFKEKT